jgi:hypothetical protein
MDTGECVHKWTGHEKEVTKVGGVESENLVFGHKVNFLNLKMEIIY